MALVEEAEPKRRPHAIDSTAVVEFAQDEALRKILLPQLAQQRELDREEAVIQFVRDKREKIMVEMLRRTEVEKRFVTEEQQRTLYRDLAGEFTLPMRTFFAGAWSIRKQLRALSPSACALARIWPRSCASIQHLKDVCASSTYLTSRWLTRRRPKALSPL